MRLLPFHLILSLVVAVLIPSFAAAQEPTIIQPFEGSQGFGQYAVEFDQTVILVDNGESFQRLPVEGITRATLMAAPEGKALLEIARSFENALSDAGFEILFSRRLQRGNEADPGFGARQWVRDLEDLNAARTYERFDDSPGTRTQLDRTYTFAAYYLSARRQTETDETYFTLTVEDSRNYYLMEEITRAIMADDTVTISELGLTVGMDAEGKAILYGVQFDIGSSVLRPSSTLSIEVIANVLRDRPGNFYVVGHTSDTGPFDLNMQLSQDRAAAIIVALESDFGIDTGRLQPIGVGPAAPLASNQNEAGRQLNRRVELVERLE